MRDASWTYEVPSAGAGSTGLEEYLVESRAGEPAGKVMTVLQRGGRYYLAVERGLPPLQHDLRAVPWDEVETVDHAALAVRLRLSLAEVGEAARLDPAKGVEGGPAEATRAEPPGEEHPTATPGTTGPVDRTGAYATTFALAALGLFSVLAVILLGSEARWAFALAVVPATLLGAALVAGYRLFRRPFEGTRVDGQKH